MRMVDVEVKLDLDEINFTVNDLIEIYESFTPEKRARFVSQIYKEGMEAHFYDRNKLTNSMKFEIFINNIDRIDLEEFRKFVEK